MARIRGNTAGIPGDECDCGRRATVLHCNSCGSSRIYARSGRGHKHLDGTVKLVETQFRCQTCGHLFIEEERKFCEAPPVNEALAKLKVQRLAQARQQGEYLRPADEKLAQVLDKIAEQPQVASGSESVDSLNNALNKVASEITEQAPELSNVVNPPELPKDFILPNGLDREEYSLADRAFRLEWAQRKLVGQDTGISVEEYVERRLRGELL